MEPASEQKLDIPEDRLKTSVVENKPESVNKLSWLKNKWVIVGIAVAVFLIVTLLVVKLVGNKKTTTETVTLNYWGLWEDQSVMNTIISDFEAKNPGIKVIYKRGQRTDYRTRLSAKLAKTGGGEEDVDIFRFHNTWVPMMTEYLEPVPTEVISNIGLENDFLDVYKGDLKVNNKWLSVPIMYDGIALFYNKTLLEEAKIEVPKGWWELEKAAAKLTVKDSNGVIKTAGAGLGIANGNVDHWSDILGLMMKQNGINFGKDINTDKNLEDALKYYASFAKSSTKVWDETLPNTTNLFAAGKLAFYFGPSWRVFDLQNLNKDLRYGITTVPQLPINGDITAENPELTDIHWASYWTEGVNNKSKHKKEAWKFLEFLSSKEALEKMYTAQSQLRSFGEIYPRKSMSDKLKDNASVWPFLSVANKASSWYLASETGDNGVNAEMQKYFTDAINGLSRTDVMPAETISTLKNGISQLQKRYSLNK
ncbi:MAG: extracellular solute-binding protein [Candidatus Shapirobacteria bacterium]|nr:extracellular solute-binding protein [Candidatus Shapirobacteria bacterium]